jgi:3'-phosphoadenosine 5'-phosphosulfate sulfotransferase (PAPS reductase)/FAD synthetase
MIIAWWSAGVTSAVATKLAIEEFGVDNVLPVYFQIDSAHKDNKRFMRKCEEWYGRKIHVERSPDFKDQYDVIEKTKYVNGPSGARCTMELKKKVRQRVESEMDFDGQVFGFEYEKREVNRALRFKEQYPQTKAFFPLIERGMTKRECLYFLEKEGIKRPHMYKLGYKNNNCIGCVKGGAGYWNKIRQDFPEHFDRMAKLERQIGHSCMTNEFLDELNPKKGHKQRLVLPDCGNFCDIEFGDLSHPDLEEVFVDPKLLRSK